MEAVGPNGKVGPENIREMKYLRAVLNGDWFTTVRRLSTLICHRDVKAVSKRVCIGVLSMPAIRLRRGSQSMEYQMLQKRDGLASPRWGKANIHPK